MINNGNIDPRQSSFAGLEGREPQRPPYPMESPWARQPAETVPQQSRDFSPMPRQGMQVRPPVQAPAVTPTPPSSAFPIWETGEEFIIRPGFPGMSGQYLNGYLRGQIGKNVTVNFLIGMDSLVEKTGRLSDVGFNYIILEDAETGEQIVCDFFNIKFVRIHG